MPARSQSQYRGMQAAAHGNSTLGIPKDVGEEFAEATPDPKALPARKVKNPKAKAMADMMRKKKMP